MFIPMEASHNQKRSSANNIHSRKSNLSGASIDEQIRHLHKTRNNLLQLREQINNKLKKVSEVDFIEPSVVVFSCFPFISFHGHLLEPPSVSIKDSSPKQKNVFCGSFV